MNIFVLSKCALWYSKMVSHRLTPWRLRFGPRAASVAFVEEPWHWDIFSECVRFARSSVFINICVGRTVDLLESYPTAKLTDLWV